MLEDTCGAGEAWRDKPESRLAVAVVASAFHEIAVGSKKEKKVARWFITGSPAFDFWTRLASLNPDQVRERLEKWEPILEANNEKNPRSCTSGETVETSPGNCSADVCGWAA